MNYPQLNKPKTLQQFGGVCHFLVEDGNLLWICRTGGLEVLEWQESIKSVAFLPLLKVPIQMLKIRHGVCLYFNNRSILVKLQNGTFVIKEDKKSQSEKLQPQSKIPFNNGTLELLPGANKGLIFKTEKQKDKHISLTGYSRPQFIATSGNPTLAYVGDIGVVRRLYCNGTTITEGKGFGRPGWPKDLRISRDGSHLFAANVFGLELYSRSSNYGTLVNLDAFQRTHFRCAKVRELDDFLIACDEARGIHLFEWKSGLKCKGGIILPGGAWDVSIESDIILAACGPEGVAKIHWDKSVGRFTECGRANIPGRTLGVLLLKQQFLALSSKGIFTGKLHSNGLSVDSDFLPCSPCWSAVESNGKIFVAAGKAGVIVISLHVNGRPTIIQQYKTIEARDICCLAEGTIIIADGRGGISFLDIERVTGEIKRAWVYSVPGFCRGITCYENSVYVGAGDGGLIHIEIGFPDHTESTAQ